MKTFTPWRECVTNPTLDRWLFSTRCYGAGKFKERLPGTHQINLWTADALREALQVCKPTQFPYNPRIRISAARICKLFTACIRPHAQWEFSTGAWGSGIYMLAEGTGVPPSPIARRLLNFEGPFTLECSAGEPPSSTAFQLQCPCDLQ